MSSHSPGDSVKKFVFCCLKKPLSCNPGFLSQSGKLLHFWRQIQGQESAFSVLPTSAWNIYIPDCGKRLPAVSKQTTAGKFNLSFPVVDYRFLASVIWLSWQGFIFDSAWTQPLPSLYKTLNFQKRSAFSADQAETVNQSRIGIRQAFLQFLSNLSISSERGQLLPLNIILLCYRKVS